MCVCCVCVCVCVWCVVVPYVYLEYREVRWHISVCLLSVSPPPHPFSTRSLRSCIFFGLKWSRR